MPVIHRTTDPNVAQGVDQEGFYVAPSPEPPSWTIGAVLAMVAGTALGVIGVLALARAGVDRTWYTPVVQVLGYDHTALLGLIELGVGIALLVAGLMRALNAAAFIATVAAAAAVVVAVQPSVAHRQLAMEQGWAVILAVCGFALAIALVVLRPIGANRRVARW